MNTFRSMAMALVACAGVLSVTACTAGVTTASSASSPATSPAATSHSVAATTPGAAPSASTVAISGSIGSFPVPSGAKVAENIAASQQIIIFFSGITPAAAAAFYAKALPQAGYAISGNAVIHISGTTEAYFQFSGHGYKGDIVTLASFKDSGVSIAGLGHNNVTEISLMP